jgi:hypothetical protein
LDGKLAKDIDQVTLLWSKGRCFVAVLSTNLPRILSSKNWQQTVMTTRVTEYDSYATVNPFDDAEDVSFTFPVARHNVFEYDHHSK